MNRRYWLAYLWSILLFPCIAAGQVVIDAVQCNPPGKDSDGEWVRIVNIGSETVSLEGWKFFDGKNHVLNAPPKNGGRGSLSLAAGEAAYLANKAEVVVASVVGTVIDTIMSLNNKEETLRLLDGSGQVVDEVSYRNPDGFTEGELCYRRSGETNISTISDGKDAPAPTPETSASVVFQTVPIHPPPKLTIDLALPATTTVGSMVRGRATVFNAEGKLVPAKLHWSWGDARGMPGETQHIYDKPGIYAVVVTAEYEGLFAELMQQLQVVAPELDVAVVPQEGVQIRNDTPVVVDLSGWRLKSGPHVFIFPENTRVLPGAVLFLSFETLDFPGVVYGEPVLFDARNRRYHFAVATTSKDQVVTTSATSSKVRSQQVGLPAAARTGLIAAASQKDTPKTRQTSVPPKSATTHAAPPVSPQRTSATTTKVATTAQTIVSATRREAGSAIPIMLAVLWGLGSGVLLWRYGPEGLFMLQER